MSTALPNWPSSKSRPRQALLRFYRVVSSYCVNGSAEQKKYPSILSLGYFLWKVWNHESSYIPKTLVSCLLTGFISWKINESVDSAKCSDKPVCSATVSRRTFFDIHKRFHERSCSDHSDRFVIKSVQVYNRLSTNALMVLIFWKQLIPFSRQMFFTVMISCVCTITVEIGQGTFWCMFTVPTTNIVSVLKFSRRTQRVN